MQAAAKVHKSHGERDAHRLFDKHSLSLKVKIRRLKITLETGQVVEIPYFKAGMDIYFVRKCYAQVKETLQYILTKFPELLFGGDSLADAGSRCLDFWLKFQEAEPNHAVFGKFRDNLHQVVPLAMHGDKGRTLKKSPIACYSFEAIWGLPAPLREASLDKAARSKEEKQAMGHLGDTCMERCRECQVPWPRGADSKLCTIQRRRQGDVDSMVQSHNSLGHSFLSKYMVTCIPHSIFDLEPETILDAILKEVCNDFEELFDTGVEVGSQVWYAACIGCKGDAEWHADCGRLTRCYQNVGSVNSIPMCHLCDAADDFGDVSDEPGWLSTVACMLTFQF